MDFLLCYVFCELHPLYTSLTIYSLPCFPQSHKRNLLLNTPHSAMADRKPPSIRTSDLSYAFPDGSDGLQNVNLDLPAGARCLLIGGT